MRDNMITICLLRGLLLKTQLVSTLVQLPSRMACQVQNQEKVMPSPISHDMVAYNSSDSNIKSEEKMNSELRNKWKESISGHESESREQQNGKSSVTKATAIVIIANPVSAGRSTEQHDGESRTESKEKSAACGVRTIITPGPDSNPNEQHMLNSEPDLS